MTNQKQNNIIVINGKRYDAKTGAPLNDEHNNQRTNAGHQTYKAIDGMTKSRTHKQPAHSKGVHNSTTKSHTLKRTAVKKPNLHARAQPKNTQQGIHTSKHVVGHDHDRAQRAKHVAKSHHVAKFSHNPTSLQAQHQHVPVAKHPKTPVNNKTHTKHNQHPEAHSNTLADTDNDLSEISKALASAVSHEMPRLPKKSRMHALANKFKVSKKLISVGTSTLAVVILGGFFVFQNMPTLAMRMAASRSGVEASLPGYNPSGFAMNGPIQYSPGSITLNYQSNTDPGRAYSVTQASSNWNSQTLLDSFVATNRRPYQTYQGKGKTIFVYDTSNATWVDSGIWYKIEGDSSLNSDQLLRLANSL